MTIFFNLKIESEDGGEVCELYRCYMTMTKKRQKKSKSLKKKKGVPQF